MKKNDSINHIIIKAFEDNHVSPSSIDVGHGHSLKNDKRYSFCSPKTYEQDNTIKYVVKYITDKSTCIVWNKMGKNVKGKMIPRYCFSIKANLVNEAVNNKVVSKWVEFSGHNRETVLVCSIDTLQQGLHEWLSFEH